MLRSHLLRASERLSNLVLTLHQTGTIFSRRSASLKHRRVVVVVVVVLKCGRSNVGREIALL